MDEAIYGSFDLRRFLALPVIFSASSSVERPTSRRRYEPGGPGLPSRFVKVILGLELNSVWMTCENDDLSTLLLLLLSLPWSGNPLTTFLLLLNEFFTSAVIVFFYLCPVILCWLEVLSPFLTCTFTIITYGWLTRSHISTASIFLRLLQFIHLCTMIHSLMMQCYLF